MLSQPSLPFAVGKARAAPTWTCRPTTPRRAERAADGCQVLGLRFRGDRLVGTRFDTLQELLGDAFIAVELPERARGPLGADRAAQEEASSA